MFSSLRGPPTEDPFSHSLSLAASPSQKISKLPPELFPLLCDRLFCRGALVVVSNIPFLVDVSLPRDPFFGSFVSVALSLGSFRDGDCSTKLDFGRSRGSFGFGGFVVLSLAIVWFVCMYFLCVCSLGVDIYVVRVSRHKKGVGGRSGIKTMRS